MKFKDIECKECDNATFLARIRRDCEDCEYKTNNQCTQHRGTGLGCCQLTCKNCGNMYVITF
jgi:hypothetical protein